MMSREMKVEAMVVKAINEGYEFLGKGMGSYESMLAHKRSEGYDVRCWYTSITKNGRQWIMYGKKKESKRSGKAKVVSPVEAVMEELSIDYESMTVKQLKDICKERKIAGYSKMNKNQMIQSLAI